MPNNRILEQALAYQNKAVVADDVNGEGILSLSARFYNAGRITAYIYCPTQCNCYCLLQW